MWQALVPIYRKAYRLKLISHIFYIGIRPIFRIFFQYGGIFCRKPKKRLTHRMKDIKAFHLFISSNHIAKRIISNMSHMNFPEGYGNISKYIVFFFAFIFFYFKNTSFLPFFAILTRLFYDCIFPTL